MKIANSTILSFLLLIIALSTACTKKEPVYTFSDKGRTVPEFIADSAYYFIEKQLSFGPRNPNSTGHSAMKVWLRSYLGEVSMGNFYEQKFKKAGYDHDILNLSNFIIAVNLQAKDRIVLAAHWDTRPRADNETDPKKSIIPIWGADDGGSGVAIILELLRIMKNNQPDIGIDFLLFDGEDYGYSSDLNNYFLGSRYWSTGAKESYKPRFGILLDMVGAKNAAFYQERYSLSEAPYLVSQIWDVASDLGHSDYFIQVRGGYVTDDHVVMNAHTNFKTIDIINHNPGDKENNGFAPHWHTLNDDISIIDKNTLKAVGQTLLELIYNRM